MIKYLRQWLCRGGDRYEQMEVSYIKREVGQTHLSKAAFADDFEVVKITGFDPNVEKQADD